MHRHTAGVVVDSDDLGVSEAGQAANYGKYRFLQVSHGLVLVGWWIRWKLRR
jgi:hypothetical protein